jgi:thymidylate synthase
LLVINAKTSNEAWVEAIEKLINSNSTGNNKYFRDEAAVFCLDAPSIEPKDDRFPMSQSDLDTINQFMVSGENEDNVCHEWTKLYYHRLFDAPNPQIEFILGRLSQETPRSSCHASLWDKNIDQEALIQPCTLVVWARVRNSHLDLHIHAHSSDAYGKLLMNLQEFISLHIYLSERSGFPQGKYRHFIDSLHLQSRDIFSLKEIGFLK